jgi:hypothetical protein
MRMEETLVLSTRMSSLFDNPNVTVTVDTITAHAEA